MQQHATYVGIDVHAKSLACKGVNINDGQEYSKVFKGPDKDCALIRWASQLPGPVYCAYESGCTGFDLARKLRAEDIDCDIIAVSSLARTSIEKRRKSDKIDACAIRREITNPVKKYSCVWVPSEEIEGARDLARLRVTATDEVKAAKLRISALLLKYGHVWQETTESGRPKAPWGKDHMAWIKSIDLDDPVSQQVLDGLLTLLDQRIQENRALREKIADLADTPRFKPYVDGLRGLKDVNVQTAFLAVAEIGDFRRFKSPRRLSSWLGTAPSESSSGNRRSPGPITKQGDGRLRRAPIECNAPMRLRQPHKKYLLKGRPVSGEVEAIAAKANRRLFERYLHMVDDLGKSPNAAKVAVASEMIKWIWVIGRQVDRELGLP
ncbi:IS110 family transposase [Adlercreutzia sp. ZJ473]|uniref:IS110 family transposase n=1 Tax=Adlercreutzia sp. ZJ473 TaxID=2722822 RepID=UPI00155532FC|nr:IS110 family transposase [Adlercreutzia sp. ZJ473]